MRKFHPYAVAAEAKGRKIYHLNIGQPDVETPPQFFEAVRNFSQSVLEYAPSPGVPELIDAVQKYYDNLNMHFEKDEILITTGGSEALSIVFQCILDDGDEVLIPEPFYPNYATMVNTTGASIHPIPTSPRRDTATLTGLKSRRRSMSTPAPLSAPTPATPPALC
ncbi:MAG: aminotransferase class I/II-fold pyridoxal phosphate-dependent enzyme [Evtepia gabavorous]